MEKQKRNEIIFSWAMMIIGCCMIVIFDGLYHTDVAEFVFRMFAMLTIVMINLALLKYCFKEK